MKSKVLLLLMVLTLCIGAVSMTSCDVGFSETIDHKAQVDATDLLADEDFMEAVKGADGVTPTIGENGNWWFGDTDSGIKAEAVDGQTPTIGENGNWWFGDTDSGIKAVAVDGQTPTIGENGNWFIADVDLGIKAVGTDGVGIQSVEIDADGNLVLFYTDETSIDLGKVGTSLCKHNYGKSVVGIDETCTSIGYSYQTCSVCGYVKYTFREANGHTFGTPITIKQGTKSVLLYTCSVCGGAKIEAEKVTYSEGLEYGLIDDDSHYRVEGIGTCTDVEIIIPDEYEGKPVTEIGEKAFYESPDLVSVTIPETVSKIGDKAFSKCEKLETVDMPDKIEIGLDVFRGSINVEIKLVHELIYVSAKEASCTEFGNIEYYYCEPCNEFYKDAEGNERIYEVTIAPSHEFVDGSCIMCGTIQEEVTIVSVDEIGYLGKFALGTLENAIGLPKAINVTTADYMQYTLAIDWDMSGYIKNMVGTYTIVGYIQLDSFHMAEGLTNRVEATVEIVDYMEGTADVVFVLDISGSMGGEINNVKDNIIAFAEAIEARGVSARWSAITYSDYTYSSAWEEQTQVIMNGAEQWFISTEAYKTAISNITLANGGDAPEVAIDGLMMASTLSTRADARVFYILLTDNTYKVDNHYGVGNMDETVEILDGKGVNVSVITSNSYYYDYSYLCDATGGIYSDIYGNFSEDLLEELVPIIYAEVVE